MSMTRVLATTAATALAAGAALVAGPAAATMTSAAGTGAATSAYVPDGRNAARNAEFEKRIDAALAKAAQRKAAGAPRAAAYSITYDDSQAPSFDALIDQSAQIWNSSVSAVQLVEVDGGADLDYYEGNDARGSYYSGSGQGDGFILMDYAQSNQYDPLRIVAHETGHALGLPDRYTQPCSKLMSGGGPGPSCTNPNPDGAESAEVNALWGGGFVSLRAAG